MTQKLNTKSPNISFISISNMINILKNVGTADFFLGLASYLEQGYYQWEQCDKSRRFTIEGFSALRYLDDLIGQNSFHQELELVANPENPWKLYGLVFDSRCPFTGVEGF